jgi:hypothetical protein
LISPLRYLHRIDGVSTHGHRLGRKEWVLSRGLMRYLRIDLNNVPANRRMAALTLELRLRKPYADTGSAVVWQGGWAGVFLWDAGKVDATLREQLPRHRPVILPESTLYARATDGSRLLRVMDGFEGQYWLGGQLLASRWWPALPALAEWDGFGRDAGFAATSVPAPESLPLLSKPWAKVVQVGEQSGQWNWMEPALYTALAASLVYGAVDYRLEASQLNDALKTTQDAADKARARAGKLVDARESAMASQDRAKRLLSVEQYVDPLTILAEMGEALPDQSVSIRGFEYQSGKLKVTLQSTSAPISGSQMVEALQKAPDVTNPKALIGSDPKVMAFAMEVRPWDAGDEAAKSTGSKSATGKPSQAKSAGAKP